MFFGISLFALFYLETQANYFVLGYIGSSIAINLCGLFLPGFAKYFASHLEKIHLLVLFCSKDLHIYKLPKAWRSGFQI
jgi:hypothetical protein